MLISKVYVCFFTRNEVPRVSSFVVINLASALYEIWHFMIERLNFLNHDLIVGEMKNN